MDTVSKERALAWHAQSAEATLTSLQTDIGGLSMSEASERLVTHGPNELPATKGRPAWQRFFAQFNNVLIYFLLIAATAAFVLGHHIDGGVIVAVVIVNAIVGFIQEGRAEQALNAIRDMIAPMANVVREGRRASIPVRQLVPGDLVLIEAGDKVPADLRLLRARRLLIDEALLTGESVAAEKVEAAVETEAALGDRHCMAYSGTLVVAGQGTGIVVETGMSTEIGRISRLLQDIQPLSTPLLRQIDAFATRFTWVVFLGGLLLFAFAVLVRDYDWITALIAVVALAVGVVPEGLPAVITITLAIGVRRMAVRKAVIRKLPAVETLGATSVICTDKTGTLTRNEMTARRVVMARNHLLVGGAGYAPEGEMTNPVGDDVEAIANAGDLLRCGLLCNNADLFQVDGKWQANGDPMEGALVALAMKAGLNPGHVRAEWPRIDEIPFDAAHRYMAALHRGPAGEHVIFVKGAAETLLAMGRDPVEQAFWDEEIAAAGAEGERVLGFAMKRLGSPVEKLTFEMLADGLLFLGIVGFIDPPRPEVAEAVAECRSAGIAIKMITGDHAATALAIARQLNLAIEPTVLTGAEIEVAGDDELRRLVETTTVFARTTPEHKLRIVRALQSNGHVVAMTGDGVNDAPSLTQADVGTAMGIKGTEAAKEAAEMVLLDDNFASIVNAVREGRTVHDNIRKVVSWELPTNGAETLAVVLGIFFGFALPMTATQILWVNLVLASTLGLVLAFEPTEPGVMKRRPRRADAPILSPFLLWRVILVSLLLGAASLGIFFYALSTGRDLETARTMVVNMFIVGEIFYLFNVRYLHVPSVTLVGVKGTPAALIAIAILVAAQLVFTFAPFMNDLFETRPLGVLDGLLIVGLGAGLMILLEFEKVVVRRMGWFKELRA